MARLLALISALLLSACGVETATTAATSAEIKRREMEAAKQNLERAQKNIEQSTQQSLQRAGQTEEKSKD
jgi:ABC-type enterochelin transport system substrate-binding protein